MKVRPMVMQCCSALYLSFCLRDISTVVSIGRTQTHQLAAKVPPEAAGRRLDQVLAALFPDYSRTRLQQWLRTGLVTVDGKAPRPRDPVWGGERILVTVVVEKETPWRGESEIPLEIVYQDRAILVINKPPGLVVHPGAGNREGTLVNALLHYAPELANVPRAGVVHRLDKDTSGLLVVARSLPAQKRLVEQLQARSVKREYVAIVLGVMTAGGTIEAPIGRHPVERTRMAVVSAGKEAVSHFRVLERFRAHSYIKVQLETGRTHQIRVHMAYLHHPLVGDPTYGGRLRVPADSDAALEAVLRRFKRQALHAGALGLIHPESGEALHWEVPLPADMQELLEALRADARSHD
jgi:23S rRNA pseudouridine1911/1915/1917 synthase